MLISIHLTSLPSLGSDVADEQGTKKPPEQAPQSKLCVNIYTHHIHKNTLFIITLIN